MNREDAFWARITDRPDGCWIWPGVPHRSGYGRFVADVGVVVYAHRYAWESHNGQQIPDGMQIDHLCRNRICVNPAHLEVVTQRENLRRSEAPAGINARKTHCPQGHSLADAYIVAGKRKCRPCQMARSRERHRAISAQRRAQPK